MTDRPASHLPIAAPGGRWTAQEIAQQPEVWAEVAQGVARDGLAAWVADALSRPDRRIVLTGAGTSAYVGECLAPALAARWGRAVTALATTDLVAHPREGLPRHAATLLVSFARSGNSPESVAALTLAAQRVADCRHLVITCNPDGALARQARARRDAHVHVLPARTNDRGFAMTSSFTSMLAAAAQAFGVIDAAPSVAGADALAQGAPLARALVARDFRRVVFLGAGALKGLAHEAALKMLELTDGRVVAVHESPLGFRHGPKTIVDDTTLVVLFLSPDSHARRYDLDLLRELRADGRAGRVLAIGTRRDDARDGVSDLVIGGLEGASDVEAVPPLAVVAQLLAYERSAALGLTPDEPCVSGTVHRVVRGVTIHPFEDDDPDAVADGPDDAMAMSAPASAPTGGADVPRR